MILVRLYKTFYEMLRWTLIDLLSLSL